MERTDRKILALELSKEMVQVVLSRDEPEDREKMIDFYLEGLSMVRAVGNITKEEYTILTDIAKFLRDYA